MRTRRPARRRDGSRRYRAASGRLCPFVGETRTRRSLAGTGCATSRTGCMKRPATPSDALSCMPGLQRRLRHAPSPTLSPAPCGGGRRRGRRSEDFGRYHVQQCRASSGGGSATRRPCACKSLSSHQRIDHKQRRRILAAAPF
eukprot:scaffold1159_cov215-Pinguiococcus_pyrenoidosus.AAC.25